MHGETIKNKTITITTTTVQLGFVDPLIQHSNKDGMSLRCRLPSVITQKGRTLLS